MDYKRPESVLVVVYTLTGKVLLLERQEPTGFWQSVTGSMHRDEHEPIVTARRELEEETGLVDAAVLCDCHKRYQYPILPQWRHRYRPDVSENTEHLFQLELPEECAIRINPGEHSDHRWLPAETAAAQASSWSNRDAIQNLESFRCQQA